METWRWEGEELFVRGTRRLFAGISDRPIRTNPQLNSAWGFKFRGKVEAQARLTHVRTLHGLETRATISPLWHGFLSRAECSRKARRFRFGRSLGREFLSLPCYHAQTMASLTYRTAGESHGKALIALVEGLPAGVVVDSQFIDGELRRRQGGYGRGGRQKIETDRAVFLTGVRMGRTIGSPIAMEIPNKDDILSVVSMICQNSIKQYIYIYP